MKCVGIRISDSTPPSGTIGIHRLIIFLILFNMLGMRMGRYPHLDRHIRFGPLRMQPDKTKRAAPKDGPDRSCAVYRNPTRMRFIPTSCVRCAASTARRSACSSWPYQRSCESASATS
jgi:hypothetical protein